MSPTKYYNKTQLTSSKLKYFVEILLDNSSKTLLISIFSPTKF